MKNKLMRALLPLTLFAAVLTIFLLPKQVTPALAQTDACPANAIERFGVNVHRADGKNLASYDYAALNLGWYLDYSFRKPTDSPYGIQYAHMIRTGFDTNTLESAVGPIVDSNPGALWLAGNEPDRSGQDGVTAEVYASFYHDVYTFIKDRDPSAQVAIAGILQPSKLRLKYLDTVLATYQSNYGTALPVDVFNIHNFVMSERVIPQDPGDIIWGASVPPGMSATDPDIRYLYPTKAWDIALFQQQLRDMRQWMADNGYRNKPLIVSEYGVLLPDYWDLEGVTTSAFMTQSFDFMLGATDANTGYPADGNRLVQQFSWFSMNFLRYDASGSSDPDVSPIGLNGELFSFSSGGITALGNVFKQYTESLIDRCNIPPTATPSPTPTEMPTEISSETPVETPTDASEPVATETPGAEPTPTETSMTPEVSTTFTGTPTGGGTPVATATSTPVSVDPMPVTSTPTATLQPGETSSPTATTNPNGESSDLSSLFGTAWYDFDRDGIIEANEQLMSNIVVELTWAGPDGQMGTADDKTQSKQTDEQGNYRFDGLQTGIYKVQANLAGSGLNSGNLVAITLRQFVIATDGEQWIANLPIVGNDFDQDSLIDSVEGTEDYDGDGLPNYADINSDGDEFSDQDEGTNDTNGNGLPDFLDREPNGTNQPEPGTSTTPEPGTESTRIYLPYLSSVR